MWIPWQPPASYLHFHSLKQTVQGLILLLSTNRSSASCPTCHNTSRKKHSSYLRTLQDFPSVNQVITVKFRTQKWFCENTQCSQRIFCERFEWLRSSARRTIQAEELLRKFAFSMNCLIASKVSSAAGLTVSHDTLRRLIYQTEQPQTKVSSVIGIDDFAWRKGHTYGTVICDLLESRILALLPERQSDTVSNWLKQHPHIKIVSRDGYLAFKEAISEALQISDRWHFIKNAKKRLDQLLTVL